MGAASAAQRRNAFRHLVPTPQRFYPCELRAFATNIAPRKSQLTGLSASLASSIGIAVIVYASTNIDDLLILAVFFADPRVHVGAVVAGRFIGLAALVLASGAAALLALVIPAE